MIKRPLLWGLVLWFIPSLTVLLWIILCQPNPFYTFGVNDLMVLGTGAYAYWLFVLYKTDQTAMLRNLMKARGSELVVYLCIWSIGLTFAEGLFRATVVMSDSYSIGSMQWTWFQGYWLPVNSLSYRDVEPTNPELTNVLIVGDSFIAGYGIESHDRMVGPQLQRNLGDQYGVNIAADAGWQSVTQIEAMGTYPVRPDIVVWSHVPNDIGWQPIPQQNHSAALGWIEWFMARTYIGNRLFVHTFGLLRPPSEYRMQDDFNAVQNHMNLLDGVVTWCDSNGMRLIFVVWETENTAVFTDDMEEYFRSTGAEVISMRDIQGRNFWASPYDPHPNEVAIGILADRINEVIRDDTAS